MSDTKANPEATAVAVTETEEGPWFLLESRRSVTLSFRSKYATSGYAAVQRFDSDEARELADALAAAARDLDGAA